MTCSTIEFSAARRTRATTDAIFEAIVARQEQFPDLHRAVSHALGDALRNLNATDPDAAADLRDRVNSWGFDDPDGW